MSKKDYFAKFIRAISIPPAWVSLLLLILYLFRPDVFNNIYELLFSLLFLVVLPIAAYPLQPMIPKYRDNKREGQRNLAFILSFFGYIFAILYGTIARTTIELFFIFITYFLSVIMLLLFNKLIKFRVSAHACGLFGPMILLIFFIGWQVIIPCSFLFGLMCWASLALKRHTVRELIGGSLSCAIALAVAYLAIYCFELGSIM